MELGKKFERWNRQGKFAQVIELFEQNPEQEMTAQSLLEYAIANFHTALSIDPKDTTVGRGEDGSEIYMPDGTPVSLRDTLIYKGFMVFEGLANEFQHDVRYTFYYGLMFEEKGVYQLAYFYFQNALTISSEAKFSPEDSGLVELIKEHLDAVRDKLSFPEIKEPFADRVKKFWAEFVSVEKEILQNLAPDISEDQYDKASSLIDNCFACLGFKVDYRLSVDTDTDEFGIHMSLAVGESCRRFELDYLAKSLPKIYLPRWNIIAGIKPTYDGIGRIKGCTFGAEDIMVWLIKRSNTRNCLLSLNVFCPKLSKFYEQGSEELSNYLEAFCCGVIGEYNYLGYVVDFKLLKSPEDMDNLDEKALDGELIFKGTDLSEIADFKFLEAYGAASLNSVDEVNDQQTIYYGSTNIDKEMKEPLRQDIEEGYCIFPYWLFDFDRQLPKLEDVWESDGSVAFQLILLRELINENPSLDEAINKIVGSIFGFLNSRFPNQNVFLGLAIGYNYIYIDILSFNFEQTIRCLDELMKDIDFVGSVVRVSRPGANMIAIGKPIRDLES